MNFSATGKYIILTEVYATGKHKVARGKVKEIGEFVKVGVDYDEVVYFDYSKSFLLDHNNVAVKAKHVLCSYEVKPDVVTTDVL